MRASGCVSFNAVCFANPTSAFDGLLQTRKHINIRFFQSISFRAAMKRSTMKTASFGGREWWGATVEISYAATSTSPKMFFSSPSYRVNRQGYGIVVSYPQLALPGLSYHTIPYHTVLYHTLSYHTIPYHTISYHTVLARVTLYLTDKNVLFVWPYVANHPVGDSHRQIKTTRPSMTAWNRGVTRASDPEPLAKKIP